MDWVVILYAMEISWNGSMWLFGVVRLNQQLNMENQIDVVDNSCNGFLDLMTRSELPVYSIGLISYDKKAGILSSFFCPQSCSVFINYLCA